MKKIILIDDHSLIRKALAVLIDSFADYHIMFGAANGKEFIEMLDPADLPDIVLMDISMPVMNGYETTAWITQNHPSIKVIALTMIQDERSIIKMLQNGVKGFVMKDVETEDLKKALDDVVQKGIYINDLLYKNLLHSLQGNAAFAEDDLQVMLELSEREKEFLRLLCTDKSYKEIAASMYLSPRTIDGYRDHLFSKLKVASRVGLVMFAIRNSIAKI
ncbi:MAG: hypothetical protein RLZZ28_1171 [Bacteroidota bacterium]